MDIFEFFLLIFFFKIIIIHFFPIRYFNTVAPEEAMEGHLQWLQLHKMENIHLYMSMI